MQYAHTHSEHIITIILIVAFEIFTYTLYDMHAHDF